jgi:HAD superfamily hydrolase (TIGR01509 family)
MNRIQGLFLDLDGTLADSMLVLRAAFIEFLNAHQLELEPEVFRGLAGVRLPEIMAFLKERYGLSLTPEQMVDDYLDAVGNRYESEAKPAPGALGLLEAARECGVHVAVVTSSPESVARNFLASHGLKGYVSTVVSADCVSQGKPHPEPFLTALKQSGVAAAQGVAVEDSAAGAKSAMDAGLATYLINLYEQHPQVDGVAGYITRLDELVELLS